MKKLIALTAVAALGVSSVALAAGGHGGGGGRGGGGGVGGGGGGGGSGAFSWMSVLPARTSTIRAVGNGCGPSGDGSKCSSAIGRGGI